MFKQVLATTLLALTILIASAAPAWAAPGKPIGPTPMPCTWRGAYYQHGAMRASNLVVNGQVIRTDYYICQNGTWYYHHSSDD